MKYFLRNCRNGKDDVYPTSVEITENDGVLCFVFEAENCQFYCPHNEYNGIHSFGDACEILIGTDVNRKVYYEIEINPKNQLMIAKMIYQGVDDKDVPVLDIDFIEDCFVKSEVVRTSNGYIAKLAFDKARIQTGEGEIFFNAYRLETDGGEKEKHLLALEPTMKNKFHVPEKYVYLKDYLNK